MGHRALLIICMLGIAFFFFTIGTPLAERNRKEGKYGAAFIGLTVGGISAGGFLFLLADALM
jgi:hypothetical protein